MIALLRGTVARVGAGFLILDVNGVGYKVQVPVTVIEALPEDALPVALEIHMQVREDDISLFGFNNEMDLRVFELLLTVSGVGPKSALALLSSMSAQELAQAVTTDDVRKLTRAPGIGARTAQRMVLELKEKFAALGFERKVDALVAGQKVKKLDEGQTLIEEVSSALMNLGYSKVEAQRATDAAYQEKHTSEGVPKFADVLRAALNRLTKA